MSPEAKPELSVVSAFRGGRVLDDHLWPTVEIIVEIAKGSKATLSEAIVKAEVAARRLTADEEVLRVLADEDAVKVTSKYVHVWWIIT